MIKNCWKHTGISWKISTKLPGFSKKKLENYISRKAFRKRETISPWLLALRLDKVFKLSDREGIGAQMNGYYLNDLWCADDIVLFSNTVDRSQQVIEGLKRESARVGTKINTRKIKVMAWEEIKSL